MSDLKQRLQTAAAKFFRADVNLLCEEAAAEIERLEVEVAKMQDRADEHIATGLRQAAIEIRRLNDALAAARSEEREACAKLVSERQDKAGEVGPWDDGYKAACRHAATAIRARSQETINKPEEKKS